MAEVFGLGRIRKRRANCQSRPSALLATSALDCGALASNLYAQSHMVVLIPSLKKRWIVSRRTALVVEDNPHLQWAMRKELERMEFQVLSAQHYEAAALHLAHLEPKIACVDVQLPCKSGYQLCEHIRRALGFLKLPILMTSDHGSPTDMAYAEDAGANAFLCKPFSMREFGECVESLLSAVGRITAPTRELQLLAESPGWFQDAAARSGQHPTLSAA